MEQAHRCYMVNARAERQAARSVTAAAEARKRCSSFLYGKFIEASNDFGLRSLENIALADRSGHQG